MNDTQEEVWADIPDFPDYSVSNLGRVRSFRRTNDPDGVIMKPNWVGRDRQYAQVQVFDGEGFRHNIYISKLVTLAFIDRRCTENVHYFDGDPMNVAADNLWFKRGPLIFSSSGVERADY